MEPSKLYYGIAGIWKELIYTGGLLMTGGIINKKGWRRKLAEHSNTCGLPECLISD
jgi:hypothetical protein